MCKQIPSVIYGYECYFSPNERERKAGFIRKNGDLYNTRSFKLKELFSAEKSDENRLFAKEWRKVNKTKLFVGKKKRQFFSARIRNEKVLEGEERQDLNAIFLNKTLTLFVQ